MITYLNTQLTLLNKSKKIMINKTKKKIIDKPKIKNQSAKAEANQLNQPSQ